MVTAVGAKEVIGFAERKDSVRGWKTSTSDHDCRRGAGREVSQPVCLPPQRAHEVLAGSRFAEDLEDGVMRATAVPSGVRQPHPTAGYRDTSAEEDEREAVRCASEPAGSAGRNCVVGRHGVVARRYRSPWLRRKWWWERIMNGVGCVGDGQRVGRDRRHRAISRPTFCCQPGGG
jgi:hypothetical protein